jgi:hypothetical protein
LDDWLAEWQIVFTQCKTLNLPEVYDNRASVDFLNAVKAIDIHFAENQLDKIQILEEEGKDCPDILTLLDRFETRRRISPVVKGRSQPAFATLQGKSLPESPQKKRFNKVTKPPTPCLCGEEHFYSTCPYLMESTRPAGWTLDPETLKRVDETLQKTPWLREKVEAAQHKLTSQTNNRKKTPESTQPLTNSVQKRKESAFATCYHVGDAYSTSTVKYELHDSFLLDSATTIHISNDFQRFANYEEAKTKDCLIAGDTTVPILGYGTVTVYARTPDDRDTHIIRLQRTAYSPTFHTSLISLRRAMENGIDWLIRLGLLVDGDGPICKVFDKFDQWVIEYNPVQSDVSGNEQLDTASDHGAFATSKKSSKPLVSTASKDIWHRRLGHVSMDAIEHLPDALSGVQVVRSQTLPKSSTSPCEGCAVANLQHQISRRPAQRASRPFERVHFDLIQMNRAYNGDEWAMHFMCDKIRSHYTGTRFVKSPMLGQLFKILQPLSNASTTRISLFGILTERKLWSKEVLAIGYARKDLYSKHQLRIHRHRTGLQSVLEESLCERLEQ